MKYFATYTLAILSLLFILIVDEANKVHAQEAKTFINKQGVIIEKDELENLIEIGYSEKYIKKSLTEEEFEDMKGFEVKKEIADLLTSKGFMNENGVFITPEELDRLRDFFSDEYILYKLTDDMLQESKSYNLGEEITNIEYIKNDKDSTTIEIPKKLYDKVTIPTDYKKITTKVWQLNNNSFKVHVQLEWNEIPKYRLEDRILFNVYSGSKYGITNYVIDESSLYGYQYVEAESSNSKTNDLRKYLYNYTMDDDKEHFNITSDEVILSQNLKDDYSIDGKQDKYKVKYLSHSLEGIIVKGPDFNTKTLEVTGGFNHKIKRFNDIKLKFGISVRGLQFYFRVNRPEVYDRPMNTYLQIFPK
ncbi:hypothetical protein WAK64_00990 [Bacillus spongiae]|uniref:Uncharacterized protein n=1 Tax=Bacillus spongiae TaxID=2683610 RepID=A0ABU8H8P0_9BACI